MTLRLVGGGLAGQQALDLAGGDAVRRARAAGPVAMQSTIANPAADGLFIDVHPLRKLFDRQQSLFHHHRHLFRLPCIHHTTVRMTLCGMLQDAVNMVFCV